MLRTNLADTEPDTLWRYYMQLTAVEESFRTLKGDLGLRPIYHQKPERIEAHLFVVFRAYCLITTLRQQLRGLAGGLMPRTVLEKLSGLMMLDVSLPTLDGRELVSAGRTEPEPDVQIPARAVGAGPARSAPSAYPGSSVRRLVVPTSGGASFIHQ